MLTELLRFPGKLYYQLNLLNLDIVAGAVVSSMAFARFLNVNVEGSVYALLGLAVWVIYTFDRLMDVKSKSGSISSARHNFHHIYFKPLSWLMVFSLLISVVLLFLVPLVTVFWGAVLSGAVLAYLSTIHLLKMKWLIHKEVVIAIIYSGGVMLGPLSISSAQFDIFWVLYGLGFTCLAMINLLIFSVYDKDFDVSAQLPSLVTSIGARVVNKIIWLLAIVSTGITVLGYFSFQRPVFLVFSLMLLPLIFIHQSKSKFTNRNYRLIGDAVFILPALALL